MPNWEALSDLDVEVLVRDLLAAEWKIHVESFRRGPDGGIDLRAFGPAGPPLDLRTGELLIGQVKHYPTASSSRVIRAFRKEAARGLTVLSGRYVAVTTAKLTRAAKDDIAALFQPPLHPSDVMGREDLEALLARHEDVERRHIRLWLTDTAVLSAVLHRRERDLSKHVITTISREAPYLLHTRHYEIARWILSEAGSVIIAGPPGTGKTSTALLLIADLVKEGWELIVASDRLDDGERLRDDSVRQVLYYDDFLGASLQTAFLEGKNEDSRLLALLEAASSDPFLRVVLTTREYVLAAARRKHPRLLQGRFDLARVLIDAGELDAYERAGIIYRRVYHSPCRSVLDAPAAAEDWLPVLGHSMFNPRLVMLYTEARGRTWPVKDARPHDANGFITGMTAALDDPSELWRTIYDDHLSEEQRQLLQTLVTLPPSTNLADLIQFTSTWVNHGPPTPTSNAAWRAAVRVLDGDFLTISSEGGAVSFANASIDSYVRFRLAGDFETVIRLIENAILFEQVERLWRLLSARLPGAQGKTGSSFVGNWREDQEREVIGTFRLAPLVQQNISVLRDALRRTIMRTLNVGRYSLHPAWGTRPGRWMKANPHTIGRLQVIFDIADYLGLDADRQFASTVMAVCMQSIEQSREDPSDIIDVFKRGRSMGASIWQPKLEELMNSAESIFLEYLAEGYDFVMAVQYLELTGRASEIATLRSRLRTSVEEYPASEDRGFWTPSLVSDVISEFQEAAALIDVELSSELDELRTRLNSYIRAERLRPQPSGWTEYDLWNGPVQVAPGDLSLETLIDAAAILIPDDFTSSSDVPTD